MPNSSIILLIDFKSKANYIIIKSWKKRNKNHWTNLCVKKLLYKILLADDCLLLNIYSPLNPYAISWLGLLIIIII